LTNLKSDEEQDKQDEKDKLVRLIGRRQRIRGKGERMKMATRSPMMTKRKMMTIMMMKMRTKNSPQCALDLVQRNRSRLRASQANSLNCN
jgi:hypothetical protein